MCRPLLTSHQHLFFHTQLSCLETAICCSPLLASPLKSSLMYSILAFFGTKGFPFLSFISFLMVYILSPLHRAMPFSNELFPPFSPLSYTSADPHIVLLISWALFWVSHILQCFQLLKEAISTTYNIHTFLPPHSPSLQLPSPPAWLIQPQNPGLTAPPILTRAPGQLALTCRGAMGCCKVCVWCLQLVSAGDLLNLLLSLSIAFTRQSSPRAPPALQSTAPQPIRAPGGLSGYYENSSVVS